MTATHNARLLAISLGGALVLLIGLLYTARNYRLSHRGQVTDRFTKALERLGSDELYVRISGIHALEHVLRDSADHHIHVVEVLVAFIRDRAPRAQEEIESPIYPRPTLPTEPAPDVQAALTALAHRPRRPYREVSRLNLTRLYINLTHLHLRGAALSGARLVDADLAGAQLEGANLAGARLDRANLTEARLDGAHLHRARFNHANLGGARFHRADLTEARFERANLAGAWLEHAFLSRARLKRANLHLANLRYAHLAGAGLDRANLSGAVVDPEGGWWPEGWEFHKATGTLRKGQSWDPEAG